MMVRLTKSPPELFPTHKPRDAAKKVPTRQLPNWLVRVVALFDPGVRQLLPLLGNIRNATSAKAERVLGWKPRSREDAVVATAESLVTFGIVGSAALRRANPL